MHAVAYHTSTLYADSFSGGIRFPTFAKCKRFSICSKGCRNGLALKLLRLPGNCRLNGVIFDPLGRLSGPGDKAIKEETARVNSVLVGLMLAVSATWTWPHVWNPEGHEVVEHKDDYVFSSTGPVTLHILFYDDGAVVTWLKDLEGRSRPFMVHPEHDKKCHPFWLDYGLIDEESDDFLLPSRWKSSDWRQRVIRECENEESGEPPAKRNPLKSHRDFSHVLPRFDPPSLVKDSSTA